MKVQPVNGNVLLAPVDGEERTAGGIYVPDTARERPTEGIVKAVSENSAGELMIGDRVVYQPGSGEEVTIDGSAYRLLPESSLLAKYVEADAIP